MGFNFRQTAAGVLTAVMVELFRILPPLRPSRWARECLIVPDGPRKLDLWDGDLTPYIDGPLDTIGPDHPANEVAVMKSAQVGVHDLLLAAVGHSIDQSPCDMMDLVQPTDGALTDFNNGKLNLAIERSKERRAKGRLTDGALGQGLDDLREGLRRRRRVPALSRHRQLGRRPALEVGQAGLLRRGRSVPDDLDDQGSPLAMIEARQESFLADGDWKRLYVSTPTIKGGSEIERRYEAGDQRRWHVPCPHCDDGEFVSSVRAELPVQPRVSVRGALLHPVLRGGDPGRAENARLVRRGRWIATAPRPGAYPSYHFDALSSPFVPWDKIAERAVAAGDDPNKVKAFYNLTLGRPYELRGDAPGP